MIFGHSWSPVVQGVDWCSRCGCVKWNDDIYRAIGDQQRGTEPPCVDAPGELLDSVDLLEHAAERGDIESVRTLVRRRFRALARRAYKEVKRTGLG